ncbi:MAG: VWA domain-containing protein [Promethearchaeota archaeon]
MMGSYGLPLDLGEFISVFIQRMRRHASIQSPPSIRQGTSINQFLFARYLRTKKITAQDLLEACIHTTFFEDQSAAYEIAHELLMSALNEKIISLREVITYSSYEQLLTLKNFGADYLKRVDIIDKLLHANKEIFKDPLKMIEEIFESIKNDLSLKDIQFLHSRGILEGKLEEISDPSLKLYSDALLERYEDLQNRFKQLLKQQYPQNVIPESQKNKENLSNLEDHRNTKNRRNTDNGKNVDNKKNADNGKNTTTLRRMKEQREKERRKENQVKLGAVLRNLENLQLEDRILEKMIQDTLQSLTKWEDYLEFLQESEMSRAPPQNLLDNLSSADLSVIESKITQLNPDQQSEILNSLQSSIQDLEKSHISNKSEFPNKSQTPNKSQFNKEYKHTSKNPLSDQVTKIQNRLQAEFILSKKSSISQIQKQLLPEHQKTFLNTLSQSQLQSFLSKILSPPKQKPVTLEKKHQLEKFRKNLTQKITSQILENSSNADEFASQLSEFIREQIPFDRKKVQQMALEKGMDAKNLEALLQAPHQAVKDMISQNLDNLGAYTQKFQQYQPNARQTQELIQNGYKMQNSSILSALSQYSLKETANYVAQQNDPGLNSLFFQGIRRASGENLLKEWYLSRDQIDPKIKTHLHKILQQVVVDQAVFMVKSQMGRIKQGFKPSNQDLRPYRPGDPMENVSIKATLDNLIEQGKNSKYIQPSDILCQRNRGNTLKVLLILDKSGSMEGNKLTFATYAVAMMTYFLPKEDFDLTFFDSAMYNIKKFSDSYPIDQLVASILDCVAEGGTQIESTLQYLKEQIEERDINNRYLILLFSDLALDDDSTKIRQILKNLKPFHVSMHILNTEPLDRKIYNIFQEYLTVEHHIVPSTDILPSLFVHIFNRAGF